MAEGGKQKTDLPDIEEVIREQRRRSKRNLEEAQQIIDTLYQEKLDLCALKRRQERAEQLETKQKILQINKKLKTLVTRLEKAIDESVEVYWDDILISEIEKISLD